MPLARLVIYGTGIAGACICLLMLFIAKRVVAHLSGGGSFSELHVRSERRFSAILTTAGIIAGVLAGSLIGLSIKSETDFAAFGAFLFPWIWAQWVAFPKESRTIADSATEENYGLGWLVWRFLAPYSITLVVATWIAWHFEYGIL